MIGGDDDQGVMRVFTIEIVGEADSAVELPVVVNHRSDIAKYAPALSIFSDSINAKKPRGF